MNIDLEAVACTPIVPRPENINPMAILPFGVKPEHIYRAMVDFAQFLRTINQALRGQGILRLESLLMPANFSSIVGEFMSATIPKYCSGVVKNLFHNGHPDLIPAGAHPENAIQYHHEGIEVKGSRYLKGWQGHNPEDSWLMVVVFDSNRPEDVWKRNPPRPFRFIGVVGAQLYKSDWKFAGRSETSRRTITAAVNGSGYEKMMANWIYWEDRVPD